MCVRVCVFNLIVRRLADMTVAEIPKQKHRPLAEISPEELSFPKVSSTDVLLTKGCHTGVLLADVFRKQEYLQ